MTLTRAEFLRLLPGALGRVPIQEVGDTFSGGEGPCTWSLHLEPLEDRRLGSVSLPRHRVQITLEGYADTEAEAFLTRFLQGFQRGGG
jgi:hypothetical protein